MLILVGGIKKVDRPIFHSLLDLDFYKLTMGQFIFLFYQNLPVQFSFKNRTKAIRLPQYIDIGKLRENLDYVRTLQFTPKEIDFLAGLRLSDRSVFSPMYLRFLKTLRLPSYELEEKDGEFDLRFQGPWGTNTYWETISMSIITELFTEAQLSDFSSEEKNQIMNNGEAKLRDKINRLKINLDDQVITDFGTRRRAFKEWHRRVINIMRSHGSDVYAGTSNVLFSMLDGTSPRGTFAHELYMALGAVMGENGDDKGLKASHNKILQNWWELYGGDLSVALTDTFGSDFFFKDMTPEQSMNWKGLRHDSGDPIAFGERAIAFYNQHGVDPRKKTITFSDGLDDGQIIKIFDHFHGRINTNFGWGTTLTNDLGLKNISIIVKATKANGISTVKLSDNIAKAMGDSAEVERYKKVFGYKGDFFEECKV